MTSSSIIISEVDAFVRFQNQNRGQLLKSGVTLSLDYNALSGAVPPGGNAVTGIAGISTGAAAVPLPSGQNGNAVIVDGVISTKASTGGTDSYSLLVNTLGTVTLTDNNTGNSEVITNASYLVFDGGATTSSGAYKSAYIVETGAAAQMAAMYNAAYGRVPDLAGLEFYIDQYGSWVLPDLHSMATYFLLSPEFETHWPSLQTPPDNGGANDQAYINSLYGQILHRTPTANEVQFYVNALQGTLKDSNGHAIAVADRAQLLVYFSLSPENMTDISATNGGWLIDPTKGAVSLGAISSQAAQALLDSQVISGTINSADFSGMPDTSSIYSAVNGGSVAISGTYYIGMNTPTIPTISSTAPNVTLDLSEKYYGGIISAANITVNGTPGGSSVISIEQSASVPGAAPAFAGSGTINLFGAGNWIQFQSTYSTPLPSLVLTTTVNGWNSSDVFAGNGSTVPGPLYSAASLLANNDGVLYQGNAGNPVSGASLGVSWFSSHQLAINVGTIANDAISTVVAAANLVYRVGDVGTVNGAVSENAMFFGQDPQGNTMLLYWQGDSAHTGKIQALDIVGAVELVGVSSSSITAANFHF